MDFRLAEAICISIIRVVGVGYFSQKNENDCKFLSRTGHLDRLVDLGTSAASMHTLNILLVEDSPDYSSLVLRWLSGKDSEKEFALIWTDSLSAALTRLAQGGIDLILMDLGLPDSDGMASFQALRAKERYLPVIVLSGGDNEALAIQTIEQGAQDYLVKSTCTAELLIRTLRHALARNQLATNRALVEETAKNAKVIGVLGSAGGAGATTVACVLAAELRHHTDQATLLLEMDPNPGLIAFTMGIDPQYTIQDAAIHAEQLDLAVWEKMIIRRPGGLDILTSRETTSDSDLDAGKLRKIVTFARSSYRWIVLDLGRLSRTSKRLAGSVDEVILVSMQSIPALHQCKCAVEMLGKLGVEQDRIRIILNQESDEDPLSRKDIESLFGAKIETTLPYSPDDIHNSCVKKQLPSVNGNFRQALTGVARKIAGLPEESPKRLLLSLGSLKDRFQPKARRSESSLAS